MERHAGARRLVLGVSLGVAVACVYALRSRAARRRAATEAFAPARNLAARPPAPAAPVAVVEVPPGSDVSEEVLQSLGPAQRVVRGLGAGDSVLLLGVLCEAACEELRGECVWAEMGHKGGRVPRRVCIQGSVEDGAEPLYRHPADEQPALRSWSAAVAQCKAAVEAALDTRFNHALIQHYRGGRDFIGEHADKSLDIARGSSVVNVSVGAARTMVLRGKKEAGPPRAPGGGRATQRVFLPHGSVFVLGWETNRQFTHAIKADKRLPELRSEAEQAHGGERISLTFRTIATFRRRADGVVYGQGARRKLPPSPSSPLRSSWSSLSSAESDASQPTPAPERSWIEVEADSPSAAADTEADMDAASPGAAAPPGAAFDEEAEALAMLSAFSAENRRGDFDWEEHYGAGFDVVNFKILAA